MEFIPNLNKIKKHQQNLVITIGNFDGVHLGHQHLLHLLKKTADEQQKASMVVTFEPLPFEHLQRDKKLNRLTSLREKIILFKAHHVDHVLRLKFNQTLANLSAETFVDEVLVRQLKISTLIVGEDFCFGKERQGNIQLLAQKAVQHNFDFEALKKAQQDNEPISSTRTRAALQTVDFQLAKSLLGRPYSISGRVVTGRQLARKLGFPTANILLTRLNPPISGVFAVEVYGLSASPISGVANIGHKPTINGTKNMLEVHLFNFDHSIYHQAIRVVFLKKIRHEKRFPNIEALSHQIAEDVIVAKEFFSQHL